MSLQCLDTDGGKKDIWPAKKPCSTNPQRISSEAGGGGGPEGNWHVHLQKWPLNVSSSNNTDSTVCSFNTLSAEANITQTHMTDCQDTAVWVLWFTETLGVLYVSLYRSTS